MTSYKTPSPPEPETPVTRVSGEVVYLYAFDVANEMLTFHRVSYDHLAAAERMRALGLPANLVYRMQRGI